MGKHPKWFWIFNAIFLSLLLLSVVVEPVRHLLLHWVEEGVEFVKSYSVALFTAFFLVKGKFILKLFLKKIALLSATGLGKRYLIEKVFTHHLKVHFLDHIAKDIKLLLEHIKKNFMKFPLTKKLIAAFAFLGSLGYVSKFMGVMLAFKIFLAKMWSFLLALVLKTGSAVLYFFTDYLWGSWLGPILEVVLFSWLLALLERVPFLTSSIRWIYDRFLWVARQFDWVLEKVLHIPLRRGFRWLVGWTRRLIYRFIGYKPISAYYQLKALRSYQPSRYQKLQRKRQEYRLKRRGERVSRYKRLREGCRRQ